MKTQDLVVEILKANPGLTNDQVADEIQRLVPGSTTSAASVASMKSGAKKKGLLPTNEFAVDLSAIGAGHSDIDAPEETQDERSARIRSRYAVLERMAGQVAETKLPSLIVSGPPGLGKSFTVEEVLKDVRGDATSDLIEEGDFEPYDIISGTITAPMLYLALWRQRDGGVVVLDDCDSAFGNEECLNILKAVLDSSPERRVSYRKRAHWMEEEGVPTTFTFEGSVVFCTNIDFESHIAKGSSLGVHFSALIDRSLYLSLTMRTVEDFMTRIHHVAVEDGMLTRMGLTSEQAQEVYDFINDNRGRFYSLSLRLAHQIAICYKASPETWKEDVAATKMRTR